MEFRAGPLILAALLIAGAALAFRATRGSENPDPDFAASKGKPAKQGHADQTPSRDERFSGLDPASRRIIHRLEAELEEWQRNRPPYAHPALHRKAWEDFTRGKIGELETAQIAALAAALDKKDNPDGFLAYREAIYFIWGSRDHAAALTYILHGAASLGDYTMASLGRASDDPQGAWDALLSDKDDPAVNGSMKIRNVLYDIFKAYAATRPQEAWRLYLGEQDPDTRYAMFYGYLRGAPAGQDWEPLAAEFDRLAPPEKNGGLSGQTELASRWAIEQPEKALDWFAAHVDKEELKQIFLLGSDEIPSDFDLRVKLLVLKDLFFSTEYRLPETVAVLQHLAGGADEELAARAVSQFIGSSMSPSESLPLLAVIPRFQSSRLRGELFLQAARAVPAREFTTERDSADMTFDYPNVCLDAVRALAAEMELPDEVWAEGEAALRQIEAKEAERQGERKRGSRGQ